MSAASCRGSRIAAEIGADHVEVLTADLASRRDLHRLAADFTARHDALHLLVNNAGAHYRQRWTTADGVEGHLAVNHLAAATLTHLLQDRLQAGAPARVVNVVSATMADARPVPLFEPRRPVPLDLSGVADVRALNPADGFVPFAAYAKPKLLATICGYEFADRCDDGSCDSRTRIDRLAASERPTVRRRRPAPHR